MTQDLFLKHVWGDSSLIERSAAGAFDVVIAEYDGGKDSDSSLDMHSGVYDHENENEGEKYMDEKRSIGTITARNGHITRRVAGQARKLPGIHRKNLGFIPPTQVFSDLLRGAEMSKDRSRSAI